MYRLISRFVPRRLVKNYGALLRYSNIKINPESFVGFVVSTGFLFALASSFFVSLKFEFSLLLVFLIIFASFEILFYMWLVLKADKKSKFVETVLPDVLQLMSSNLRAGMTTDRALLLSAREEFGAFAVELNRLGKEISTGKEIDVALLDLASRIKSEKLEKTVFLLTSGIRSGGQLSDLLDQTANNLRRQKVVDEKIRSNVLMYVIFIFVAVGIGAPVLFGLSSYLVEVLTKNLSLIEVPSESALTSSLPFALTKVSITVEFVIGFAILSLVTSSIMGAMVLGLISKGGAKYGVRLIPILIIVSISIFFIVRGLIAGLLGGVFGLT